MENIQSDEAFRIFLVGLLSEKLGSHAILKGGMVLRLLNCPRYTNDLDYLFIPYESKKEVVPLLKEAIKSIPELKMDYRLHSTNAQFDIKLKNNHGTFKTQVEVNVAEECPSQALSTSDAALPYNLGGHIIRVMRFDIMLAHKCAAWNERRLMRDLYDIYFIFKFLNETPNRTTLETRLANVRFAKRVKTSNRKTVMTMDEFLDQLEVQAKSLTEKDLSSELADIFSRGELAGMDKKISLALLQLVEKLRGQYV